MITLVAADRYIPSLDFIGEVINTTARHRQGRGYTHDGLDISSAAREVRKACESLVRLRPETRLSHAVCNRCLKGHMIDMLERVFECVERRPSDPALQFWSHHECMLRVAA